MEILNKKNRIFDVFFFHDEVDMILFRLTELDEYVDKFIILESQVDYKNNKKNSFYLQNKDKFSKWEDKITHLFCPVNYVSVSEKKDIDSFLFFKNREKLSLFTTSNQIIFNQIKFLIDKLFEMQLYVEDIVMLSHVDYFPDFKNLESLPELLNYNLVVFYHKKFTWTTKYVSRNGTFGSCAFYFTNILQNKLVLYSTYFFRKNYSTDFTILENGWHFSQFKNLNDTFDRIQLLSDFYNDDYFKKIDNLKYLMDELCPLEKPIPGLIKNLIEFNGKLPKNINLIPQFDIGRLSSKNFLIVLGNSEIPSTNPYEITSIVKFTNKNTDSFMEKKYEKIFEYRIVLPTSVLYGDKSLSDFQLEYGINEIKRLFSSFLILEQDIVTFLNKGVEKSLSYKEIKNSFVFDLISDIL
jgi:hypothetical protein